MLSIRHVYCAPHHLRTNGNVTPADVYYGRWEEIFRRSEEQKQRTIEEHLRYNLGRSNLEFMGELEWKV